MKELQVLVVDDERPARQKIVQFLSRLPQSIQVFEASDTREALRLAPNVDLMFLDIQMPELNGFQLIERLGTEHCPTTIFSTAYNEYAIKAFDTNAIDYLLKPYDFDRFKRAFDRALHDIDDAKLNAELLQKIHKTIPSLNVPSQIWVRQQSKIIPLSLKEISRFESDGNYVQVFVEDKKYLLRDSLTNLEQKLGAGIFVRVHRSILLNRNHLLEMRPRSHGDMVGLLKNGDEITISRKYRDRLMS